MGGTDIILPSSSESPSPFTFSATGKTSAVEERLHLNPESPAAEVNQHDSGQRSPSLEHQCLKGDRRKESPDKMGEEV